MGSRFPRALIIGAGALGLGFLAERLAGRCALCLADLPDRMPMLERLVQNGGYDLNVCRPDGIEIRRVAGDFAAAPLPQSGPSDALVSAVRDADIVLTAVGTRALPAVMAAVASILNARSRRAWVLFCENGRNVAARYGSLLTPPVVPVDTVMSRMCRFAEPVKTSTPYAPLLPGSSEMLVVEPYDFLPLDRTVCGDGPFSEVFTLMESAEFRLWEDIKLFLHNGLHAFVAYHAFLEGITRFPEVPATILCEAERVMREELVPAILFHHAHAQRATIEQYGRSLLERFSSRTFNDSILRGVRGPQEKLAAGERLLGGRDYISEAGIDPKGYASTIEAARRVAAGEGGDAVS